MKAIALLDIYLNFRTLALTNKYFLCHLFLNYTYGAEANISKSKPAILSNLVSSLLRFGS